MTYNILVKMNSFRLEVPEITEPKRSGKTLSNTFWDTAL